MKIAGYIAIAIGVAVALGVFAGYNEEDIGEKIQKDISDSVGIIDSKEGPPNQTIQIDSFEDCVAAGNPVMESYPRQCRTQDGLHFVEQLLGFSVLVSGDNPVRRGTTQSISVQVLRDGAPVNGAMVRIDIEDYGENLIKELNGFTNSQGIFVLEWEIPTSFDDIETLLAIVDVTDNIDSVTKQFRFQVYCLPGENDCKAEGN